MVKVPPGTSTIGAPSRLPTIASGQPELWMPASGLAVNPLGRGRIVVGDMLAPGVVPAIASGEWCVGVSSAGLAGSVNVALPAVCLGWAFTTWVGWVSGGGGGL